MLHQKKQYERKRYFDPDRAFKRRDINIYTMAVENFYCRLNCDLLVAITQRSCVPISEGTYEKPNTECVVQIVLGWEEWSRLNSSFIQMVA